MRDFDESVTTGELAFAVATVRNCRAEDIKVGPINRIPSGLCVAWTRCSLVTANKVATSRVGLNSC